MKVVIGMYSEIYEMDSEHLSKYEFENIRLIGDTYYIDLKNKNTYISCYKNYWIPFVREFKIDSILKNN